MVEKVVPLYQQIKEILKEKIEKKEIESLSERYIIHKFNVSSITARRVLRELREEGYIESKIGIGSFVVERKEKVKDIGVIFYNLSETIEPAVLEIIKGIEEKAEEKGYHLHLYTTRRKSIIETKNNLYHLIEKNKIQGLIILSPLPLKDIEFIKEKGTPFVVCTNYYPEIETSYVIYDYKATTEKVCEKLYKKGMRKIGIVITERGEYVKRSGDLILEGYEEFCKRKGIANGEVIMSGDKEEEMEELMKKIKGKDVEVWIIGNMKLSEEIWKRKIEGNFVLYTYNTLLEYPNKVFFSFPEYGKKGFEIIEKLINGEKGNTKIKLKPKIKLSETCIVKI